MCGEKGEASLSKRWLSFTWKQEKPANKVIIWEAKQLRRNEEIHEMSKAAEQKERALIPQIEPWVDASELRELMRVIDSTFLVEHELTKEFELLTAQLTG